MNTWKVILATMVIFGTGVITGGLVVRQSGIILPPLLERHPADLRPVNPPIPEGGVPQGHVQKMEFLNRVQKELDLNPEQRARLEKIITAGQVRNKELWEPVAKQMRQELQQVREKMRAELTPEQRVRFEELLKQRPPHRPVEPPMPERRLRDPRRPLPPPPGGQLRPPEKP